MIELYNELNYPLPKFTIDLDFTSKSEALIAQKIKNLLGLDNDSQAAPKSPDQAFDFYRKSLSDLGILVFQADKIAPRYLRGLSIHDSIFPIIVVNRQDEFNARIFSLFHDFIHILTKTSGICNNFNYKNNDKFDFETWLNKIVSKVLSTEDTHFFNPKKMNKTSQINYRNNPSLDIYSKVGELYASTVFAAFNQHLITARDVSYYFSGLKLEHFSQMEKSYLDPALAGGL
ncbi:MAG: ImmA/IrrE family metallo-endopeptidase [Deltaproteobacteria bacterium]|nr:ImmA/IrrE family metallo-endopeptidase [Deltaproteobacteria bacterium]